MIAAVDLRTNYPAVVVADGMSIVFAGSLQLGKLSEDRTKRTITPADVRGVVQSLLEKCVMADRIVFVGGEKSGTGAELVAASEVPTEKVEVLRQHMSAEQVRAHFPNWTTAPQSDPDYAGWCTGDYGGTRKAAHVLLTALDLVEKPVQGASPKTLRRHENTRSKPISVLLEGGPSGKSNEGVSAETHENPEARPTSVTGRPEANHSDPNVHPDGLFRVAGIDTGANVGIVVAEKVGPFWRQIVQHTIAVNVSEASDREDFVEGLARIFHSLRVRRVVIEKVTGGVYLGKEYDEKAAWAVQAISSRLVDANWLGGMVETLCMTAPERIEVETAPASHWRRSLLGGKRTPGDEEVKQRVGEQFPVWPAESTTHERDAAGLILWDEKNRTPPEPSARKPRAKREGGSTRKEGCTCPPHKGAHFKGCPARAPRKSGTIQKCKVCGQPKRGHSCPGKKIEESA